MAFRAKYLALGEARGTQRAYAEIERDLEQLTHASDFEVGIIELIATVRSRIDAADLEVRGKPGTPSADSTSEPSTMTTPAMIQAMAAGPRPGETAQQAAQRIIREHSGTGAAQPTPATQEQATASEDVEDQIATLVEQAMGVRSC